MSAIEACRTAALGGYVARCENAKCGHTVISYCSCRNRHCPKCQGSQALAWMAERKAELLQVPYFHIVFTLPAEVGAIAYQNKAVIYDLLFKAASDTMLTIRYVSASKKRRECRGRGPGGRDYCGLVARGISRRVVANGSLIRRNPR